MCTTLLTYTYDIIFFFKKKKKIPIGNVAHVCYVTNPLLGVRSDKSQILHIWTP
jgi:hypothetical protein